MPEARTPPGTTPSPSVSEARHPLFERMKGAERGPVGSYQATDIVAHRGVEVTATPEFSRGYTDYRSDVPAKALRRGVVQSIRHVGDRQSRRLKQLGGVE